MVGLGCSLGVLDFGFDPWPFDTQGPSPRRVVMELRRPRGGRRPPALQLGEVPGAGEARGGGGGTGGAPVSAPGGATFRGAKVGKKGGGEGGVPPK